LIGLSLMSHNKEFVLFGKNAIFLVYIHFSIEYYFICHNNKN